MPGSKNGAASSANNAQVAELENYENLRYYAICLNDIIGCRVVRGHDFLQICDSESNGFEVEGVQSPNESEGYVGTLIDVEEEKAIVMWDDGHKGWYPLTSESGAHIDALRVFDDGPTGRAHERIFCEGCKKAPIWGLVFCCSRFPGCHLCLCCYGKGYHSGLHPFKRYDYPKADGCEGVLLPPRRESRMLTSMGIFEKATVTKSRDFRWGRQCMGENNPGEVRRTEPEYLASGRSGHLVKWNRSSKLHRYCVGALGGTVEIKYKVAAEGWPYFVDHLPHLALPKEYRRCAEHRLRDVNQESPETRVSGCIGHQKHGSGAVPLDTKPAVSMEPQSAATSTRSSSSRSTVAVSESESTATQLINININLDVQNHNNFIQEQFVDQRTYNICAAESFAFLMHINEHYDYFKFAEDPTSADQEVKWHSAQSDGIEDFLRKLSLVQPQKFKKGNGLPVLLNMHFKTERKDLPAAFQEDKEMYKMYKKYRRDGAEFDTKATKKCLEELTGNEVIARFDLGSREEVRKFIAEVGKTAIEKSVAYVVIVISSHGLKHRTNSHLVITDHFDTVCLFRDVIYQLRVAVPVLCFVQACQDEHDNPKYFKFHTEKDYKQQVHMTANYLLVESSLPIQPANRNTGTGSYFIQAMAKKLRKGGHLQEQIDDIRDKMDAELPENVDQTLSVGYGGRFPLMHFEF